MAQTLGTLLVDIKGDTTQLIQGFNRAESAVNKTTKSMGNAINVLTAAFFSLQAIDLAKGYAKQVDELQSVNNRLKLVTKSNQEFLKVQNELFTQAQNTRSMYAGTIDLYGRIARSTQTLNLSQKELLKITDTVNKSMIIGGGSAESQQAALIQLGQAFSSNFKAVGQELGSIREQAPRLYEALIKGTVETNQEFKTLVDNGAEASGVFKKWAEEGKLSSEIVINALKNQGVALDSEFGKMTMTIEQSMVTAKNSIQKLIYDFDQTSGISKNVADSIRGISKSIDTISPEKISELVETFKTGAIAIATTYASVKATSLGFSAYGSIMEKINTYNKANIEIENARTKAINLGEQAVKARRLADEAFNVSKQSGLAMAEKHYQLLSKEAIQLENAAKKQQALSYSLEGTAKGFNIATIASNAFKGALASVPFIAISMAISAVAASLLNASKASKTFEESMASTGEALKEKTKNQLAYAKSVLESQIAEKKVLIERKKSQLELDEFYSSNSKAMERSKSDLDEEIEKLDEIKFKYEEINDALNEKSGTGKGIVPSNNNPEKPKTKAFSDDLQKIIDESVLIKKKYAERRKELEESGQATAEMRKKLNDEELKEIQALNKNEIKEAKKTSDEHKKILEDKQNQYYNYYEKIKDYDKLWFLEERKLREDNKYLKEDELNRLLEVEKQAFDKRNETQKEYLSADEWKDYFLKIKDYDNAWLIEQSELYVKYGDSLGENFARFAQIAKTEFYDKINEENSKLSDEFFKFKLEFDTNGLNDLGKSLYTISDITEELATEQKLYNEAISEARDKGKDTAKIEEQHTKNQLIGYSNIAGAMSTMYEEGSREAAAFQAIQTTLALIEATRAVVSQGSGDPYTAIPRMIAMAAMVSSLLGSVGIAFGMNKTSTSSDTFSSMAINEGKGTVIGDSDKVSESITKSLDILEDFAEPQYQTLLSMNKYLANISNAMGGVTTLLVRNAGFALGEGFTESETAWKNNITGGMQTAGGLALNAGIGALLPGLTVSSTVAGLTGLFGAGAGGALTSGVSGLLSAGAGQALTGALVGTGVGLVTMLVDKFILGGVINNAIGSVLGGLFGKTKVKTSLHDSGLYFADTLLGAAIESIEGSLYQTIKIKTTKKSWFSSSSSTKYKTYFENMDNELERQFSLVLANLYGVTVEAGNGLDMASSDLMDRLDDFVVKIGKVSLKGKNADEIQETLEGVFSQIGDNIAEYIFPALIPFQKVGEGLFQTMTRVATGMEEAEFYISRLGSSFSDINYLMIQNKQGNVGFEALLQSITALEEKLYPVNNGLLDMVSNLDITAEELYTVYITLEELRDRLIFLKQEAQGLSSAMIYGAGSVSDLQKGLDSFFENFLSDSENLVYETEQLIEQFNNLNIALPISKEAFKDLLSSLDLTTESGQELYGRLIILSEAFASVSDKTAESIAKLESELLELTDNGINDLSTSFEGLFTAIKGLKEIATSFIDSFSSSSLGSTRDQIKEYNKLRKQFNSFFDASGNLNANVTEKEAKDVYSKLAGLGTAIGKSQKDLQKDLVNQFEMDLSKLDLSDQILKVSIINGLGDLLGLTKEQKEELKKIANDGNITKTELNSIKGLTEVQKQGILDFASKSGYFSTEDTLQNLAQYSKLQLEAYQKSVAEETSKLSKETFTYGDYIGKQEKLDIAKTLGVSYEAAEPLIQKLQALSVSKNATADIQSLLGYKAGATSYNTTMASQLQALAPYLNYNISGIIGSVQTATAANLAEQRRQEAIARATAQYYADYNYWANTLANADAQLSNFWATLSDGSRGKVFKKYFTGVNDYETALKIRNSMTGSDLATMNDSGKDEEFLRILKIKYDNRNPPILANYIQGYAVGATNIPYDQIAQIHQGEMIIPKTFSEGLRTGELSLSATSPNVNFNNFNLMEGIKETMQDMFKSISEYPKKTHDLLDDVINGRAEMRVKTI